MRLTIPRYCHHVLGTKRLVSRSLKPIERSHKARKTVAIDGVGEEPLNTVGPHLWMLDVNMDCRRTAGGWFDVKGFVARGTTGVWEPDIGQPHTPYPTRNHVARCGAVTFFEWGQGN